MPPWEDNLLLPLPTLRRPLSNLLFLTLLALLAGAFVPRVQARSEIEPPMTYGLLPDQICAIRNPYIFTHRAGLLSLQITNLGVIGNPFINDLSAGWRGGE